MNIAKNLKEICKNENKFFFKKFQVIFASVFISSNFIRV